MLLLWFALIESPVSSYSLLCACLLQPKCNTLDFGKVQQHICKELVDSEIFLIKVSSSHSTALFVFFCFIRQWGVLMSMEYADLLNFREMN